MKYRIVKRVSGGRTSYRVEKKGNYWFSTWKPFYEFIGESYSTFPTLQQAEYLLDTVKPENNTEEIIKEVEY